MKMRSLLLAMLFLSACAGPQIRPFPATEPLHTDPDMVPFAEKPEEHWSPMYWDAMDQQLVRPLTRFFAVDPAGRAKNVNALDEVPDSSWFENRIGTGDFDEAAMGQGACGDTRLEPVGAWRITSAKPNGANPGFMMEASDGVRYLLKFDGTEQPERATAADVVGSRLYHAAGYHSPCNTIVFFDRSILQIDPKAKATDETGRKTPLTEAMIDEILAQGVRLADGRYRASASRLLEGKPLGPFTYQGTRADDPNDVIPHEDRRELRGGRLLAAWINHFDAREQNTLDTWIEKDGKGFIRHHMIDFGDSFGSLWEWDGISRRLGTSGYLDPGHVGQDFLTLGLLRRPWDEAKINEAAPTFGYFGTEGFDPEAWQPGYPNPAFSRMQEGDGAWMARILAHFRDPLVEAAVDEAHFSDSATRDELVRILVDRRDRILERYLTSRSPLSHFSFVGTRLSFRDLAAEAGIVRPSQYTARVWNEAFDAPLYTVEAEGGSVALDLAGSYAIVDLLADGYPPARLHFAEIDGALALVGVERPASDVPPTGR